MGRKFVATIAITIAATGGAVAFAPEAAAYDCEASNTCVENRIMTNDPDGDCCNGINVPTREPAPSDHNLGLSRR